ncbi:CHASE domain-containing protein [Allochromatium humboldtianum]|uniref:histidine kinase n=1 Tax=Allochromatium humboldtianum TaxID=504901 RepID=A0A850RM01_9GAMM|nr:CHASE domain-containing protein [Allochromatium humboldtianum]NVZ10501.1 CHASE domain-containing protein [Allochromatium humboldtianum]
MGLILLLALTYLLLGATGLLLAIPPGYASPVFPAAGLALAAGLQFGPRILPGVWLGSSLLNVGHAWISGHLSPTTLTVALAIGVGAGLQAGAGAWLVRHRQGSTWRALEREQDAIRFLFLGGVLAGVVSPTVAVGTLVLSGVIAPAGAPYTWWTWYVGDVLGVLAFAPLALCLFNRRDRLWGERLRRTVLPVLLTLALAILAFWGTARWVAQTQANALGDDGDLLAQGIADRLITQREILASLRHFVEATPDFSFAQFERFTRRTLEDNPDVFALSYNDLVTDRERPTFEARISALSPLGPFQITERDAERRLIRATTRPEYVTVRYIVPLAGNTPAVGYDINSEPIRRLAIERARTTNAMAVTAPILLVQESQPRVGLLQLLPIETQTPAKVQAGSRRDFMEADEAQLRHQGFAVGVIKVDEMIDIATDGRVPPGLSFQLTDVEADPERALLYRSGERVAGPSAAPATSADWSTHLRMGDRDWLLTVSVDEDYRQAHLPWLAWAVGVVGLLFATLLQVLMLGMTGRAAFIQRQNEQLHLAKEEIRVLNADLEAKVEARTAEARAASAAKSEFLSHMSHEIRTPLNAVLGLVQVMEQSSTNPEQRDLITSIRAAGRSLMLLLNDILDLSKIEAGKLQLESRPFFLASMLEQLESLLGPTARAKGLHFAIDTAPLPSGALVGDPLRLEQILTNLIGNAIKFTDQGEVRLSLRTLDESETGARLRFDVTDTGVGIAPSVLPQLFTAFNQGDSGISRRFGGTGLGLAISKRMVELMGGAIGVKSREGVGSRFWFELPFARTDTDPVVIPTLYSAGITAAGSRLLGGHYLIVDDNALNLDVLERMLELQGARVTRAGDGHAAMEQLRTQAEDFDAVLMDVQMPVLDGLSATRAIRGELGLTQLPVIAVTAGVLKEEQQRVHEAGVDALLPKPVELEQLVAILSRWAPHPTAGPDADAATSGVSGASGDDSPVAALPVIAGLDPAHVDRLTQGDVAFYRRLLSGLVAEARGVPEQVRADLAQGVETEAAARLHRLCGVAANVGAVELVATIRALETALHKARPVPTAGLEAFERQVARLLASADPWLAQTEPTPVELPVDDEAELDPAQLAALREALATNRPRSARQLFAELHAGLSRHYGPKVVQAMATPLAALDFPAALGALDAALSGTDTVPDVPLPEP